MAIQQTTIVQVGSRKSVVGAVVLALFFGPLGMLYSTVVGALVMLVVNIVVVITTLGLGLLITLPICAMWAGIAASSHNSRSVTRAESVSVRPERPVASIPERVFCVECGQPLFSDRQVLRRVGPHQVANAS